MTDEKDRRQGLAERAAAGDQKALASLIQGIQDRIYGLAVKMLYSVSEAEDAAQEILIRIITRLDSFRGESRFDTWAMKIAVNHLLSWRKRVGKRNFTFRTCEEMILRDQPDPELPAESALVVHEMRIICVQGLFQCLDRNHRVAYILARTMDVTGGEGAEILGITPANFRQRVSRARKAIQAFLVENCELFEKSNPCKCRVQARAAIDKNLIDPVQPRHISRARTRVKAVARLEEMEEMAREVALMRIHPDYAAPGALAGRIQELLAVRPMERI